LAGVDTSVSRVAFTSELVNRGKRSVAVDLAEAAGLDLLLRLVDRADVFLTSFLPEARAKLGIDVDDVMGRNPSIVYARGSGQGPVGPDAEKAGFDSVSFWARTGLAAAATPPESPVAAPLPGLGFGDVLAGAVLAGGVCAALAQRNRTGRGVVVDGSLFATGLWAMQPAITAAGLYGVEDLRLSVPRGSNVNPLAINYRTADGTTISLTMLDSQRHWRGLCAALGRDDLADDPRYATAEARAAHSHACTAELDATFGSLSTEECRRRLATQDGAWNDVVVAREVLDDPQARANGYIQDVDYGLDGTAPLVAAPVQFDGEAPALRPGPAHGADTELVLLELGIDWDEISRLKDAGVIL
jgi:crotonobetainyl-CoA:carnitine CoA-transferase CaiB-like acyl-CoA transferase